MARIDKLRSAAFAALRPPPRLRLSEWIERHMVLPHGVVATPGPIKLWPFQREVADAIGDPTIERVTLVKGVRIGFSSLLTGALGSYIVNDPSPIMLLLPTEADCRSTLVSDIEPVFAASPALGTVLTEDVADGRKKRNTMLTRRFPGGSLKVNAARSPRNLRAHTVRVLFVDEADAMDATAEGDPIRLAERRTLSFPDRKIVVGSTPVFEETSAVLNLYRQSDMRVFEVPCPSCGAFTEIEWSHIEWTANAPETAAFRCPHCRERIAERYKNQMVEAARWRATAPTIEGHAGFRLNTLVSPHANASWGKLAAEFLESKARPEQLQTFVNTILAQGWREAADDLDDGALASRAEPFGLDDIPDSVLAVTVGIDVQRDRLEITYLGWSDDDVIFALGHRVIVGSPLDEATWQDLDATLRERWRHPFGGTIGIDAACVDAGDGGTMDAVLAFCRPRIGRRVLPIKGMAGSRQALTRGGKVRGGGNIWLVGVDGLKSQLLARLRGGAGIRVSASLPGAWFEQLAAERRVVRYSRGQPTHRWERKAGMAAEALDCTVYAMAARQAIGPSLAARIDELGRAASTKQTPHVVRSAWMNR